MIFLINKFTLFKGNFLIDEINYKKENGTDFSTEEIIYFIYDIIHAFAYFQAKNIYPSNININNIIKMNDGHYLFLE